MLLIASGVMVVVTVLFLAAGIWSKRTDRWSGLREYLYVTGGFALTTALVFAVWSVLMATV